LNYDNICGVNNVIIANLIKNNPFSYNYGINFYFAIILSLKYMYLRLSTKWFNNFIFPAIYFISLFYSYCKIFDKYNDFIYKGIYIVDSISPKIDNWKLY